MGLEKTNLGKWGPEGVEALLRVASAISDLSDRIDFVSRAFLDVPYGASTLIGSPNVPELLVVDLSAVDCFTYLDYVEAMRLSRSLEEFERNLRAVRYRGGEVAYGARNHFFTDWAASPRVEDVTGLVGKGRVTRVPKTLNRKGDGSCLLPGIRQVFRQIGFLPSSALDESAAAGMRTGDYVGIFTEDEGLDVTHVGIAITDGGEILFRHASSVEGKVVDEDFRLYVRAWPGIVLLRPR